MTHQMLHTPPATDVWEACDQCQAPLEARQRYCVVCGTRRLHAEDPAARFLADVTRRARTADAVAVTPAPRRSSGVPLILALIPVAAAIGVLAGRGGDGSDQQIVDALKAQRAPIVNVTGGGTAAAAPTDAAADSASAKSKAAKKDADSADSGGKRTSDGAKVIASGPTGDARQLEGSKVTAKQLAESKKAVKQINESKGKAYVDSQRNLPDQIVIP